MDKHTVAFLLIDVAVVIAAARVGGWIAQKLRQPAVVGEIAAGIALGPSLLGLLPGDPTGWLFPTEVRPLLGALAQIGLVLFMFIVGLELDMRLIKGRERAAGTISICSIILPFVLGAGLAVVLYPSHNVVGGTEIGLLGMALFLGIAMSITAFPVLARILTDRGMQRTAPGVFSLAAAAVDDILAWSGLAFVIAVIQGGSPLAVARILGLTLVYAAVMFLVVRPLLRRLLVWRNAAGRMTPDILAVILIGLFCSAAATDLIGIHQIFGAFVFGAVMPKVDAEELTRDILERLEQVSVLLLLPMFFVVTGLEVNLAGIGPGGWWQLLLVLAVAIGGKFVGAYTGARLSSIPGRQSAAIAVLMNTRGLTELVILSAGKQLGVLSDELFAMMVVMALVTTILTEPLLRLVYPDKVVDMDIAAAERKALASGTSARTLIVLADLDADLDDLLARHRRAFAAGAGTDVVLAGILASAPRSERLEVGVPLVPDLSAMASAVEKLGALGARLTDAESVSVLCRFSADPAADLQEMADNSNADVVVVDSGWRSLTESVTAAPIVVVDEQASPGRMPGTAPLTCVAADSRSGRTAVMLAGALAVHAHTALTVVTSGSRRRLTADLAPVATRGVDVTVTERDDVLVLPGTLIIAPDDAGRPSVPVAFTVIDQMQTSEESLAQRIDLFVASAGPTDRRSAPTSELNATHPTASPERH
ncbi:cation/H(+) antiporter [Gordonia desulfuricans]|uniref:Cation/H(+) antiporter n=1 Tax=Gordonia desulfuricans TaxID=89051 RepID=A0A7K3LM44_9ACTN|nr:cation:proton antiporter [Gordonia desulfuricans]NDK89314.1 cation/H(+) antiporter [Gordonia desulfuricans]